MKKIALLLLFFGSLALQRAFAQPTFTISPQQVVANQGEQKCLVVSVQDFTDIIAVKFSIRWDAGVVTYQSVNSFNPSVTGLDIADITVNSANGYLTLNWTNGQPCQSATNGVTLNDGAALFQICFTATADYGYHTPVEFSDDPLQRYVSRINANCNDIGEFTNNGFISIGVPPLKVRVSSADGFQNDIVCLDFKVEDFDKIVAFQFAVKWDSSILEYQSATASNLPNFISPPSLNNIGTTQVASGILNVSWLTTLLDGISVPDGTPILQVCFKIKGTCGQSSVVTLGPNPPEPVEVINSTTGQASSGVNIGLLTKPGEVTVNCFNPNGIGMTIEDKNVCPGETFTVDVKVQNFQDIVDLLFGLKWNPQVIDFSHISYPQTPGCVGFGAAVDQTQTGNGLLYVDWHTTFFGCDLGNNFTLMRLHFTVSGSSGTSTSIAVFDSIYVEKLGPPVQNIGINNNNGLVSVCELTGLTVVASSTNANPGEMICIGFTAQDFDEINRMQYTIGWEPNILQFDHVEGFGLPDLTLANFFDDQALNFGVLGVEWENNPGLSLPDGSNLFNICFNVIGDPGNCSAISFEEVPWSIDVQTESSNNTNVGLNGQSGSVCVDNPLIFTTDIPDVFGVPSGQVCLDFTVQNFTQLTNLEFTINWNTGVVLFQSIQPTGNLPNFTPASYNTSLTGSGILTIDWASPNAIQGTTVPDGTSIFQLCFTVIGDGGECSPVVISDSPSPVLVTTAPTGGANLGLTSNDGSVCVSASLSLVDAEVTPVLCPSSPSGAIDITVSGGSGQYNFLWSGQDVSVFSEDQTGLDAGEYEVTVTDAQNPGIKLELDFEVGYGQNALQADAGQDTTFSCGGFILTLNGAGSSEGSNIAYLWEELDNGLVLPGEQTNQFPKIIGGHCYRLTVQDMDSGCTDTDTVCIEPSIVPAPNAGDSTAINCLQDTVMLDGNLSTTGFDNLWTAATGAHIVPGTETYLTPLVTQPGWYYLTQTDAQSGCTKTDSVFVSADLVLPVASAGLDTSIGCTDASILLDGSSSSTGSRFVYAWSPVNGGEVCGDSTTMEINICAPGRYELMVTDTVNGCTATDLVEVMGDTLKPSADAGADAVLSCFEAIATLDGSASTGNGTFNYAWKALNGGNILSPDTTAISIEVDAAGTYQLTVTNPDNGCAAVSEVVVTSIKEPVAAAAKTIGEITCANIFATLDATGSAAGPAFTYVWSDTGGVPVGTEVFTYVPTPGIYTLTVTNIQSGCTGEATTEVVANDDLPEVSAGIDKQITCTTDPQLEGFTNVPLDSALIQWIGPGGINCLTNGTTPTPIAHCAGEYILTVFDERNGCLNTDTLEVTANQNAPVVDAGVTDSLTCTDAQLTLQGTTSAVDFTALWTAAGGLPIDNPGSLTPIVHQAGTYFLQVTDHSNGCTAIDNVTIVADTTAPVADAGSDDNIDCAMPLGDLSAANSTLTGTTLTWSVISGPPINPGIIHNLDISVEVGTYLLTVQNNGNGCTSTDTATVTNGQTVVTAAIIGGSTQNITCAQGFVTLDASISTPNTSLTYVWTDASMNIIGSGVSITIDQPDTIIVNVYDSISQCQDSAMVVVTQEQEGPPAEASNDSDPCSNEAMLLGNLPEGATGVWTNSSGAVIADPAAATSLATGLQPGTNVFTWTLSLGNCLDYSSASTTVDLNQVAPSANADLQTLAAGFGDSLTLNALENDILGGGDVSFNLLSNPAVGSVSFEADGTVIFTKEKCFDGEVKIPYAICSTTCPDLCDTSFIQVSVEIDPADNCDEVPNGITPNGDGVNDALVFDLILANPDEFPDNEIIIFNRWGDVVFQAKPYNNDWEGTNQNGKDLPAATYYYVLRLSIGEGEIIRGDVTILK